MHVEVRLRLLANFGSDLVGEGVAVTTLRLVSLVIRGIKMERISLEILK